MVKGFKTLKENKHTQNQQNKAYAFSDFIGNLLIEFIVKLFRQVDFCQVYQKICPDNQADVKQKTARIGIVFSNENDGYQPEKHHTNVQNIEQETIEKSFEIVLVDESFLACDVHSGFGNDHINPINKDNKRRNPIKTRILVYNVDNVLTAEIRRHNAHYIRKNHAQIQRQCMPRPSRKAGLHQKEENRPDEYQTKHKTQTDSRKNKLYHRMRILN